MSPKYELKVANGLLEKFSLNALSMFIRSFSTVGKRDRNFWQFVENRKEFLLDVEKKLGIQKPEDWYEVKSSKVLHLGGSGLLNYFDHSISKAVTSIFPQYNLKAWKFKNNHAPRVFTFPF